MTQIWRSRQQRGGFTLLEVIMALLILGLLAGSVYSISSAALAASRATLDEQFAVRRLESFLRVTQDAFLNLPREGTVEFRIARSPSGAPVPEIVFEEAAGLFGIPSLGGGSLILAARPRADGTRTMSILRVPKETQGIELERLTGSDAWIPLLPRVERVRWTFFANGEWRDDWPENFGRPIAVRLQMEYLGLPGHTVDSQFWIPPLRAPVAAPADPSPTP